MYEFKILEQCGKKLKVKSQKIFWANSYICRSYKVKTWKWTSFAPTTLSWIGS